MNINEPAFPIFGYINMPDNSLKEVWWHLDGRWIEDHADAQDVTVRELLDQYDLLPDSQEDEPQEEPNLGLYGEGICPVCDFSLDQYGHCDYCFARRYGDGL